MSTLISVLMGSSFNLGELISCLRFHMPPTFVEFPTSHSGGFLLSGTSSLKMNYVSYSSPE